MFVSEIMSGPRYVEGRKFVERTLKSTFDKGDVTVRTIYMDGKPILKEYTLEDENTLKNVWKSLKKGHITQDMTLDKKLNIII